MNKNIKINPQCLSFLNPKQKIDVENLLKETYDLYLKIQRKLPTTKEMKQRKI